VIISIILSDSPQSKVGMDQKKKSTAKLKSGMGLINVIAVFAVIVTVALYVVL
jgi:hypothetical protein